MLMPILIFFSLAGTSYVNAADDILKYFSIVDAGKVRIFPLAEAREFETTQGNSSAFCTALMHDWNGQSQGKFVNRYIQLGPELPCTQSTLPLCQQNRTKLQRIFGSDGSQENAKLVDEFLKATMGNWSDVFERIGSQQEGVRTRVKADYNPFRIDSDGTTLLRPLIMRVPFKELGIKTVLENLGCNVPDEQPSSRVSSYVLFDSADINRPVYIFNEGHPDLPQLLFGDGIEFGVRQKKIVNQFIDWRRVNNIKSRKAIVVRAFDPAKAIRDDQDKSVRIFFSPSTPNEFIIYYPEPIAKSVETDPPEYRYNMIRLPYTSTLDSTRNKPTLSSDGNTLALKAIGRAFNVGNNSSEPIVISLSATLYEQIADFALDAIVSKNNDRKFSSKSLIAEPPQRGIDRKYSLLAYAPFESGAGNEKIYYLNFNALNRDLLSYALTHRERLAITDARLSSNGPPKEYSWSVKNSGIETAFGHLVEYDERYLRNLMARNSKIPEKFSTVKTDDYPSIDTRYTSTGARPLMTFILDQSADTDEIMPYIQDFQMSYAAVAEAFKQKGAQAFNHFFENFSSDAKFEFQPRNKCYETLMLDKLQELIDNETWDKNVKPSEYLYAFMLYEMAKDLTNYKNTDGNNDYNFLFDTRGTDDCLAHTYFSYIKDSFGNNPPLKFENIRDKLRTVIAPHLGNNPNKIDDRIKKLEDVFNKKWNETTKRQKIANSLASIDGYLKSLVRYLERVNEPKGVTIPMPFLNPSFAKIVATELLGLQQFQIGEQTWQLAALEKGLFKELMGHNSTLNFYHSATNAAIPDAELCNKLRNVYTFFGAPDGCYIAPGVGQKYFDTRREFGIFGFGSSAAGEQFSLVGKEQKYSSRITDSNTRSGGNFSIDNWHGVRLIFKPVVEPVVEN